MDTLNNKQKSTAFNSEQNDEHCINNDGEDEELQLIVDNICQSHLPKQQATGANNMEKSIGSNFELSNKAGSSSVGYHVETDARKVISVEGVSNPWVTGHLLFFICLVIYGLVNKKLKKRQMLTSAQKHMLRNKNIEILSWKWCIQFLKN